VAELLLRKRLVLSEAAFVEVAIWKLPRSVKSSGHRYKYRLALVSEGTCVLRYDNEAGKGDHKHVGTRETRYEFANVETLQADFWRDVEAWRRRNESRNA